MTWLRVNKGVLQKQFTFRDRVSNLTTVDSNTACVISLLQSFDIQLCAAIESLGVVYCQTKSSDVQRWFVSFLIGITATLIPILQGKLPALPPSQRGGDFFSTSNDAALFPIGVRISFAEVAFNWVCRTIDTVFRTEKWLGDLRQRLQIVSQEVSQLPALASLRDSCPHHQLSVTGNPPLARISGTRSDGGGHYAYDAHASVKKPDAFSCEQLKQVAQLLLDVAVRCACETIVRLPRPMRNPSQPTDHASTSLHTFATTAFQFWISLLDDCGPDCWYTFDQSEFNSVGGLIRDALHLCGANDSTHVPRRALLVLPSGDLLLNVSQRTPVTAASDRKPPAEQQCDHDVNLDDPLVLGAAIVADTKRRLRPQPFAAPRTTREGADAFHLTDEIDLLARGLLVADRWTRSGILVFPPSASTALGLPAASAALIFHAQLLSALMFRCRVFIGVLYRSCSTASILRTLLGEPLLEHASLLAGTPPDGSVVSGGKGDVSSYQITRYLHVCARVCTLFLRTQNALQSDRRGLVRIIRSLTSNDHHDELFKSLLSPMRWMWQESVNCATCIDRTTTWSSSSICQEVRPRPSAAETWSLWVVSSLMPHLAPRRLCPPLADAPLTPAQ